MPVPLLSAGSIGTQPPEAGKPRRNWLSALSTGALSLSLLLVTGCSTTEPEQALRRIIDELQAAVVAKDVEAILAPVAEDFTGPNGMDRQAFRRTLIVLMLRHREVGVRLGPLQVAITGQRASVRFTAATTGGAGLLPDQARLYQVETGWRLDGEQWQLVSAVWQ